ncbi:hypothetical protein FJQ87_18625 (plasmid) [Shewanella sp. SNU WT4]|uniref:hypothetical protein n=1 Tax=Shewanella sp. SNU WT4 TaxID=2590015 RepID=UPI00112A7F1E|nr:hypothetical protein [Shewanella sp. SNU WT4]QDF68720.1 hypothetical protein FJQ87_18625 [Shewanella sp. SNU WT4]
MKHQLPRLACLPLTRGALKKHRALHGAAFEKVFKKDGKQYRYYSDTAGVCRGEYLLSQLSPGNGDWVAIIELPELGKWYGLHANGQCVLQEKIASIDTLLTEFDFALHQSERIECQSSDTPEQLTLLFGDKLSELNASIDAIPSQYSVSPASNAASKYGMAIGALSLCALGGLLAFSRSEPPPAPPINPWEQWTSNYTSKTPAAQTLLNSAQLVALGWSLPMDWQPGTVMQSGNAITLPITPRPDAQRMTIKAWAAQLPASFTLTPSDNTFSLSMTTELPREATLFMVGGYPDKLHDRLKQLGAKEVLNTTTALDNGTQEWRYEVVFDNIHVTMLTTLSELFKDAPVFIDSFSVTALTPPLINMTMTLTLVGK